MVCRELFLQVKVCRVCAGGVQGCVLFLVRVPKKVKNHCFKAQAFCHCGGSHDGSIYKCRPITEPSFFLSVWRSEAYHAGTAYNRRATVVTSNKSYSRGPDKPWAVRIRKAYIDFSPCNKSGLCESQSLGYQWSLHPR